jgi:hypothetical protein
MKLYMGTHMESWLEGFIDQPDAKPYDDIPLCVSHNRLAKRKRLPRARYPWLLDSGAFSLLQKYGEFPFTPREYMRRVRLYRWDIGKLEFCAPMDRMCEPIIRHGGVIRGVRFAGTGLTEAQHMRLTVDNYLELRTLADELPWIPVIQGWTRDAYRRCRDMYEAAGVDLASLPRVGIGSVCRRQGTDEIEQIIREFPDLRLHGFGVKMRGLKRYGHLLASCDSLSWSERGKHVKGCQAGHASEANCATFALRHRRLMLADWASDERQAA